MANTKSSKKSIRQTIKRAAHNRTVRSRLKTLGKRVAALAKEGDPEKVKAAAIAYVSALDKAAKRNIIHPNKASRSKSAVTGYILGKA